MLNYDDKKMYIEKKEKSLIFTNKDLCTVYSGNIEQYSTIYENEFGIMFLTSKCSYNEIIKTTLNPGINYRYHHIVLDDNFPKKIRIYYSNLKLKNLNKATKKELDDYMNNSILIYEN